MFWIMNMFDYFAQRSRCVATVLIMLGILLPVDSVFSGQRDAKIILNELSAMGDQSHSESELTANEVAIVNGSPLPNDYFPALTALLTGRSASITLNQQLQVNGFYFGHGLRSAFQAEVIDCGSATSSCIGAENKICFINSQLNTDEVMSPAAQLTNCALGGGIGALYWSAGNSLVRTDMFDGLPSIPAVFINELQSIRVVNDAMSAGSLYLEVQSQVAQKILCGATYLGGKWVVTAAHCVIELTPDGLRKIQPWEITASVGAYDLKQDTHLAQSIKSIHLLDDAAFMFDFPGDVALLELTDEPVSITTAGLSKGEGTLAVTNIANAASVNFQIQNSSDKAIVLGWGSTRIREPGEVPYANLATSTVPLSAPVSLITPQQCREKWSDYLGDSQFLLDVAGIGDKLLCAYDPVTQHDTCLGDSGGPLLIEVQGRLELAGLTSFGVGCGGTGEVPAVYTRIGEYTDWIEHTTGLVLMEHTDSAPPVASAPVVTVSSMMASSGGGSFGLPIIFLIFAGLFFFAMAGNRPF